MEKELLSVGFHKGEMDFGVTGSVASLSLEQVKQFRSMLVTAIYVAEDMWRREQEKKDENKAHQELNPTQ